MINELSNEIDLGKTTPSRLTARYLRQIKKIDFKLKSFLRTREKEALAEAQEADKRVKLGKRMSKIDGLPISIKDIICLMGEETTAASNILKGFIPSYDATVVKKLKDAGAIIIGKNNLDAFAHGSSTENSDFFATKNPWDLSKVPGGSSGGSAAAVSAELSVFSIGTDTGGSIRQPASFCGVVGFKPSYGRVSRYGVIAMASSLDVVGPITKNVADAKEVFNIIKGVDKLDATTIEKKNRGNKKSSAKAKVGIIRGIEDRIKDKSTRVAYLGSIEVLKRLGYQIQDYDFGFLDLGLPVYYILQTAEVSSNLSRYDGIKYGYSLLREEQDLTLNDVYFNSRTIGFGEEAKRRIMLGNFVLSSGYYDAYYKKAMQIRTQIIDGYDQIFNECEFILTPVSPSIAFTQGEKTSDPVEMYLEDLFTVVVNLAGLPAISMPYNVSESGLPTAVQFIAPYSMDEELLDFSREFEKKVNFKEKPQI